VTISNGVSASKSTSRLAEKDGAAISNAANAVRGRAHMRGVNSRLRNILRRFRVPSYLGVVSEYNRKITWLRNSTSFGPSRSRATSGARQGRATAARNCLKRSLIRDSGRCESFHCAGCRGG
jgi:hypothetical protein